MGRLPESGKVFYMGRVRWQAWRHSEKLNQFLSQFCAVGQNEKMAMLEQLLKGSGFEPDSILPTDQAGESQETTMFLDNFLL